MYRIQFKIILLVLKLLHGLGPAFIRKLFIVYQPIRCLRSRNNNLFDVVRTYTQFGDRRLVSWAQNYGTICQRRLEILKVYLNLNPN